MACNKAGLQVVVQEQMTVFALRFGPDISVVARRLPDEFLEATGLPVQRALFVAHRHWYARTDPELHRLAHMLLLVLEPLLRLNPPSVPAGIRDECERLVREWSSELQ